MFLHTGLTKLHIFLMTRRTTFVSSTVFIIFYKLGQNLQSSYFNELFSIYAKQKPVEYSPGGVL